MVAMAAILVAGVPAFASGTVDDVGEAATVAAGPQYGGVLTVQHWGTDPPNADINTGGGWQAMQYFYGTVETLAGGDFETYGPRGNNASGFESTRNYPETFWKGILAESWEATPSRITINLRRGVMVAPNDHVGLQARELTSADIVLGLDRYIDGQAGPGNSGDRTENGGWLDGVRAVDDYTVVIDISSFNVARYLQMMERAPIYPTEVVEANPQEFDNLAGTGPFMLEEYVAGSSLTFVKNPDYWGPPPSTARSTGCRSWTSGSIPSSPTNRRAWLRCAPASSTSSVWYSRCSRNPWTRAIPSCRRWSGCTRAP